MNITIGMPVHNCLNFTKLTLDSLLKNTDFIKHRITLVVVDNASSDGTNQYFKDFLININITQLFNKIEYIRWEDDPGCSKSFNEIYKTFDANQDDLCILINNDIVFTKDWLEQLLEFYNDFPECGIFSPQMIDNEEPESTKIEWFGNIRKGEVKFDVSPKWQEYVNNLRAKEKHVVDEGMQGPVICVTKDCRNAVGNWDEGFIVGCYDDCDYVLRAEKAGFKVAITHNAIIFHFGGTTQAFTRERDGHNNYQELNKQYFQKKYNVNLAAIGAVCNRSIFWTHPAPGVNERVNL